MGKNLFAMGWFVGMYMAGTVTMVDRVQREITAVSLKMCLRSPSVSLTPVAAFYMAVPSALGWMLIQGIQLFKMSDGCFRANLTKWRNVSVCTSNKEEKEVKRNRKPPPVF